MAATRGSHSSSSSLPMCVVLAVTPGVMRRRRVARAAARLFLLASAAPSASRATPSSRTTRASSSRITRATSTASFLTAALPAGLHVSDQVRDEPRADRWLHPAAARLGVRRPRDRNDRHRTARALHSLATTRLGARLLSRRDIRQVAGARNRSILARSRRGAREAARRTRRDPRRALEAAVGRTLAAPRAVARARLRRRATAAGCEPTPTR